ncbi:MAG TPA: cytochrome c [Solirubrobacteraceae bacterium]
MVDERRRRPSRRFARRVRHLAVLVATLGLVGGAYALFVPHVAVARAQDPALVREGEALYDTSCITCHGSNLQGIPNRAPSIVGVGQAAVYFQVSTGRMPLAEQDVQAQRKAPRFTPAQIDALGAFVQAHGGGPQTPDVADGALVGSDISRGGDLFRLNCAQCHNFTGRGGALSEGKYAPPLDPATPRQVYAAMLSGPANMPVFSDGSISPDEKRDIIGYIDSMKYNGANSPGGLRIGGFGPVDEGFVAFAAGLAVLVAFTLWVGSRR